MDYVQDNAAKTQSHRECVVDRWDSREDIQTQALYYMKQAEGWCSEEKASILVDLIIKTRPEIVVEIGVWGGKSLIPMAYALKANEKGKIYGIDPWDNFASIEGVTNPDNIAFWSYVDHKAVLNHLNNQIQAFEFQDQIELIEKKSEDAEPIQNIDILHVDGNHSSDASFFDVQKWVPLVKSGGWIIFDDMTWFENGVYTTAKAVEWLEEHCIKLGEFSDCCVWGIWVKP